MLWHAIHWGEFRVNNANLHLHLLFWNFCAVFHQKQCVFIIFISLFDKVSDLHTREYLRYGCRSKILF